MNRFIMSRLPYSWVKNIDFFIHGTRMSRLLPGMLWRPFCDELDRRFGCPEETLQRERLTRVWWDR
jgi:hypothetical protein